MSTPRKTAREIAMQTTGGVPPEVKIDQFRVKQKQDYDFKRKYARIRALEFYNHPDIAGEAYCAVGGLDSITLYVFLRSIGIDVPGISVSSLEDKSIQRVHRALGIESLPSAKKENGRAWTKTEVIKEFGWPIISKETAAKISLLQRQTPDSATVRHAIITGETGAYGGFKKESRMQLSRRWLEKFGGADPEGAALGYQAAPFKVSDRCCYYLKEKPCNDYQKASGRYPYMGLMASEGGRRQKALMIHGCNYISEGTKRSCPFGIFMRHDLLQLTLEMDAWYHEHWQEFSDTHIESIVPTIYGDIVPGKDGKLTTTGAVRTGCSLCCFGLHLEQRPHRFDRLRERNQKEWEFWMYTMGLGEVLNYIEVPWEGRADGQLEGQIGMFDSLEDEA